MVTMMYQGARSFPTFALALAYALAPGWSVRREIRWAPGSGRWGVRTTGRPTRYRPSEWCQHDCGHPNHQPALLRPGLERPTRPMPGATTFGRLGPDAL